MTISESVEIESKFEVTPETEAPPASAFAPLSADPPVTHELSATYHDTADLALTRHQITLRRRTGGDDAGWHLKLPARAGRLELHAPLTDEVPGSLVDAVAGLVRRRPLRPIARIDNQRRVTLLRDADGVAVVEFCDDRVTTESFVEGGSTSTSAWREWEAELVDPALPGAHARLSEVAAALLAAGATASSSSSKLARAIGPLPAPTSGPAATETAGHSPVRDALAADLRQLLDHDPGARRVDMHGVHQMRVAVRGLRSTLNSYKAELGAATENSPVDIAEVGDELKVLAAVLGKVRDIQVVDQRLAALVADLDEDLVDATTRGRLRDEFAREEKRAGERVTAALLTDRYLDLVDRLHELVELAGGGTPGREPGERADHAPEDGAGRELLLKGVDRQFKKFTRVRSRTEDDLASLDLSLAEREELTHVVRKRAKALRRNVGELTGHKELTVAPLRAACQRLHTVLGDVQDSVTARQWIRRIARRAEAAGEPTFGYGVLYEHERGFSERTLAGFEGDAAAVTAAYRELRESRRAARKRGRKRKGGK